MGAGDFGGIVALVCCGPFVWIVQAMIYGPLGGWVARQRRRSFDEGILYGALFGPLGVVVVSLLPPGPEPKPLEPRNDAYLSDLASWLVTAPTARGETTPSNLLPSEPRP